MISKKQKQILDFVQTFSQKNHYAPSLEEIQKKFKFASVSTAHFHVTNLEKSGFLNKHDNKARSISLSKKEPLIKVPIKGSISLGESIKNSDQKTFIILPKSKLPQTNNFYALQSIDNSLINENIKDGDIVLIQPQKTANNGQRIIGFINNGLIIGRFFNRQDIIELKPDNQTYESMILSKKNNLKIQGIILDVIKDETLKTDDSIKPVEVKKYRKLPLNKIILGDALIELKKLPDESCDIIIVDPPYNIGKDFGNNTDKRELSEYVSWCKEWINQCIRVMKPSGTMFIYGFSEILAYLSVEIPIDKRWLIWHYTNKNVASLNFWQRSHESIICAWKSKPVFNRDAIREPYTEGFLNGAAGKVRKGTVGRFSKGGTETIYKAHEGGALPRDVIKIPALAGGAGMVERWFLCRTCNDVFEPKELKNHKNHQVIKHPTQKPLEISRKLILSAMPPKNGVVLVPFVGTGSECVAAKQLGQSYIGFEINPDYILIAQKFIKHNQ